MGKIFMSKDQAEMWTKPTMSASTYGNAVALVQIKYGNTVASVQNIRAAMPKNCTMTYIMRYSLAFCLMLAWATVAAAQTGSEPVCIQCHDAEMMKPAFRKIPAEWRQGWHHQNGVSCHDCHGGDPTDAAMAMSPQRGFVGTPKYQGVPEFCGKCHVGILKNYIESGHGKALKASGSGPNCVTCHGAHDIQKANIDIINEQRCSQCHSYERARTMKQALFTTERKIQDIEHALKKLSSQGIYTAEEVKALFRTEAEFRTLFHTVDVSLVQEKTDDFVRLLDILQNKVDSLFVELRSRRNFSVVLMLLFAGAGIVVYLLAKTYR
jgi:nitrate/TMAO reductase-like tetraheme cytochrome c subunit